MELRQKAPTPSERLPLDFSTQEGQEALERALRRAGVPSLYAAADWKKVVHAKRTLGEYMKSIRAKAAGGRGLVLAGPVGTGKSSAAGLIARAAIKSDLTVLWQHVPDLVGSVSTSDGRHKLYRSSQADVLVWDDFTAAGLTDWQVRELDRVVEKRYSEHRTMIVTANMTQRAMQEAPEIARMVDRWADRGPFVTMSGETMRSTWTSQ